MLNCALDTKEMRGHIERLGRCYDTYIICYPNTGLSNAIRGFDQNGPELAKEMREFSEGRLCNIIAGCCGAAPFMIDSKFDVVQASMQCIQRIVKSI